MTMKLIIIEDVEKINVFQDWASSTWYFIVYTFHTQHQLHSRVKPIQGIKWNEMSYNKMKWWTCWKGEAEKKSYLQNTRNSTHNTFTLWCFCEHWACNLSYNIQSTMNSMWVNAIPKTKVIIFKIIYREKIQV